MTKNTKVSTNFDVDISTKTDVDRGKSCWVCQIEIRGDLRLSTDRQFNAMKNYILAEITAKMLESKHCVLPKDTERMSDLWDSVLATMRGLNSF